jgi:hypothetical protein
MSNLTFWRNLRQKPLILLNLQHEPPCDLLPALQDGEFCILALRGEVLIVNQERGGRPTVVGVWDITARRTNRKTDMSKWIKCTDMDDETIYVNLHAATTIQRTGKKTLIAFHGSKDEHVKVQEEPEHLIGAVGAADEGEE